MEKEYLVSYVLYKKETVYADDSSVFKGSVDTISKLILSDRFFAPDKRYLIDKLDFYIKERYNEDTVYQIIAITCLDED